MAKVKLYVSQSCKPCLDIKDKLVARYGEDLKVVDIETDEGFEDFAVNILGKLPDDGEAKVPLAFRDGKACGIFLEDTTGDVTLQCPGPDEPEPVKPAD